MEGEPKSDEEGRRQRSPLKNRAQVADYRRRREFREVSRCPKGIITSVIAIFDYFSFLMTKLWFHQKRIISARLKSIVKSTDV